MRYLPLIVGIIGGLALLLNRLTTPLLTANQSRSDALGIILSALLILVGLLWQQIQPKAPESVTLLGEEGFELDESLSESVKAELAWASHILLTNTATKTLVVWYEQKILLRRGILSPVKQFNPGQIVQRVLKTQKPTYLVKLSLYPGKIEFDYLPENTQGLIVQPLGDRGVIVLGANAPRSYTKQDENWVEAIAAKLTYSLEQSRS
ncbi:cofactor assembly of complex C subunit B [Pseudanabaena sp. PCC 6802]|uniref:cofactor assembly of complex C subunit B n=1 Tax=Pseudanabaena sp. PCC 6802 TaxID=118173 RepID=UPI00034DE255|nr:cofactor assembly of complex C subunit B [Pseudanabaena sp. PCC 6802]